ncbi:EcsC protein family protein [Pigmentiphaga humi]|uniref:EcsC protein family protein n=1 Tax=Pigmentiphaga humi TaxID=2478468 RepID=A0A3P4AZ59_9BURK|nr:EcsC family protein [Pigmentiphaga humi]VCU68770.1 EcsC protein family protein [Pigmentiphaga humi]
MPLSDADLRALAHAKHLLGHPGIAARLAGLAGKPIERTLAALPGKASALVETLTRGAVGKAMDVAVRTLDPARTGSSSDRWHKLAVGATGAAGGAFGLPGLAVELPISTTIMLRSIADIARSEGEDLRVPEARLECLHVLALGGTSKRDDAADAGYFASRAALAQAIASAGQYLAQKGAVKGSAPVLVKLIGDIAARFSVAVSEKAIAQSVPVIGAIGGGAINALFIDHFQDMGRGHFTVRRLERAYGTEAVRAAWEALPRG